MRKESLCHIKGKNDITEKHLKVLNTFKSSAVSREQVPTGPDREWSRPVPTDTDRNLLEIENRGGFLLVLKCGSSAKKLFNTYEFALSVGT